MSFWNFIGNAAFFGMLAKWFSRKSKGGSAPSSPHIPDGYGYHPDHDAYGDVYDDPYADEYADAYAEEFNEESDDYDIDVADDFDIDDYDDD